MERTYPSSETSCARDMKAEAMMETKPPEEAPKRRRKTIVPPVVVAPSLRDCQRGFLRRGGGTHIPKTMVAITKEKGMIVLKTPHRSAMSPTNRRPKQAVALRMARE